MCTLCGPFNIPPHGLLPNYTHSDRRCSSRADPLNLLIENETSSSLSGLLASTVNGDTNDVWKPPRWRELAPATDQWVVINGQCGRQLHQLVTGSIWDRYHIRLWDLAGQRVIAGAHHEQALTLGGNSPGVGGRLSRIPHPRLHLPSSHESGKDSVCDDLKRNMKSVRKRGFRLYNEMRVPFCSGWAAYVR